MRLKLGVLGVLLCGCLLAQEFRATLSGRVTDPSGAGIGGERLSTE